MPTDRRLNNIALGNRNDGHTTLKEKEKLKIKGTLRSTDHKNDTALALQIISNTVDPAIQKFEVLRRSGIPEDWRRKAVHNMITTDPRIKNPDSQIKKESSPARTSIEMTPEATSPMAPSTDPCTPPSAHPSTISKSVQPSAVTNPAPLDLRMQSFTIIKENGEIQRSSLWPMRKTGRETIKEVFDLDHEKFLAAMKEEGGYNIRKDVIFAYYGQGQRQTVHSDGGFLAQIIWWCDNRVTDWNIYIEKQGNPAPLPVIDQANIRNSAIASVEENVGHSRPFLILCTPERGVKREHSCSVNDAQNAKRRKIRIEDGWAEEERLEVQPATEERRAPEVIELSDDDDDDNAIPTSKSDSERPLANRRHAVPKLTSIGDDANHESNRLSTSSPEIPLVESTSQVTHGAVPRDTANRNLVQDSASLGEGTSRRRWQPNELHWGTVVQRPWEEGRSEDDAEEIE